MVQNNEKYYINIKTIQATIFKQVIDALKDILMDVNLEIDETGIKIVAMDNTHIVLIHLKLEADKFEIIKNRLREKINFKPDYYKYKSERKSKKFFLDLLK